MLARINVIYKDQLLTKVSHATGGKNAENKSISFNGFYRDTAGKEYFIKKPTDKKELFTELFAGKILQQFVEHGLLDSKAASSLIYADWIKLPDHSYGLIQPKIAFEEFFKVIHQKTSSGPMPKDRHALKDMWYGTTTYKQALSEIKHHNLPTALTLSLILGDYSVHSGNVVLIKNTSASSVEEKDETYDIARIDWGAAFRYYAHPYNDNIIHPAEYTGAEMYKYFTKNYLSFYSEVPEFFQISEEAKRIQTRLHETGVTLDAIILAALNAMPADLIDDGVRAQLADYMSMPSFSNSSNATFAQDMATVMARRIDRIGKIDFANQKGILKSAWDRIPSLNSITESVAGVAGTVSSAIVNSVSIIASTVSSTVNAAVGSFSSTGLEAIAELEDESNLSSSFVVIEEPSSAGSTPASGSSIPTAVESTPTAVESTPTAVESTPTSGDSPKPAAVESISAVNSSIPTSVEPSSVSENSSTSVAGEASPASVNSSPSSVAEPTPPSENSSTSAAVEPPLASISSSISRVEKVTHASENSSPSTGISLSKNQKIALGILLGIFIAVTTTLTCGTSLFFTIGAAALFSSSVTAAGAVGAAVTAFGVTLVSIAGAIGGGLLCGLYQRLKGSGQYSHKNSQSSLPKVVTTAASPDNNAKLPASSSTLSFSKEMSIDLSLVTHNDNIVTPNNNPNNESPPKPFQSPSSGQLSSPPISKGM